MKTIRNSEKTKKAIEEVYEKLINMSSEEFHELMESSDGEIAEILEYGNFILTNGEE